MTAQMASTAMLVHATMEETEVDAALTVTVTTIALGTFANRANTVLLVEPREIVAVVLIVFKTRVLTEGSGVVVAWMATVSPPTVFLVSAHQEHTDNLVMGMLTAVVTVTTEFATMEGQGLGVPFIVTAKVTAAHQRELVNPSTAPKDSDGVTSTEQGMKETCDRVDSLSNAENASFNQWQSDGLTTSIK